MERVDIPAERFVLPPFKALDQDWFLLAAGSLAAGDWNCMTVSWGGLGFLWGKPMAMIVVRPVRHTWGFTERHPTFTLSLFPAQWREALRLCGSASGRDTDKMKATGLTPVPARSVEAPAFAQAELVVECRKIYADPLEPGRFLAPWIDANYPKKDYHTLYFGEVLAIQGVAKYRLP